MKHCKVPVANSFYVGLCMNRPYEDQRKRPKKRPSIESGCDMQSLSIDCFGHNYRGNMNNRKKGTIAEKLVADWYEEQGFKVVARNFTIRGGEIDLILENNEYRVYCEVKSINYIDDMYEYITPWKKRSLQRTIQCYTYRFSTRKQERIDVVFVRQKTIVETFQHVSLS